jgi:hypothetical protein
MQVSLPLQSILERGTDSCENHFRRKTEAAPQKYFQKLLMGVFICKIDFPRGSVPFPYASGRGLELPLALVPVELLLQVCLSVLGPSERSHRCFELLAAECTYRDDGCGTEPLDYSQSSLCNAHMLNLATAVAGTSLAVFQTDSRAEKPCCISGSFFPSGSIPPTCRTQRKRSRSGSTPGEDERTSDSMLSH